MGAEIQKTRFSEGEFCEFRQRLREETALLAKWFEERKFIDQGKTTGLEVEFWLVDENFLPVAENDRFLRRSAHPQIVPEISRFNAELNTSPHRVDAMVLRHTHEELQRLWRHAKRAARGLNLYPVMIGSLPTLRNEQLGIEALSDRERYRAMNEQLLGARDGRPLHLDIEGRDRVEVFHDNILMEAAATSLQIHFQVEMSRSADYFNASLITAMPLVALAANTPFLFGQELWDETRIPIFEQSARLPCFQDADGTLVHRVTLGSGYVRESLLECFLENLDGFPVLLPALYGDKAEWLAHLRLQNGTIWRWVRPIVGLTPGGCPHLRIEQRVPASGPTLVDMIANKAFALGLTHWLSQRMENIAERYPFAQLRTGFYHAAREGLRARVKWLDGREWDLQQLIHHELVPRAREGLADLGIRHADIQTYVTDVLVHRARTGRTGAAWQRAFIATHGKDFQALVARYFELQEIGRPVHDWPV